MPNFIRILLSVVAGVVAGGFVIFLVELAGHALVTSEAQAFWPPIVALLLGTFAGALVAIAIARTRAATFATLIAAVMMGLTLLNVISFPHPVWFIWAAVLAIAAGAVGALAAMRRRARG